MNSQDTLGKWVAHASRVSALRIARKEVVGRALRLPTRAVSIHISARQARRLPYNGFES